MSTIKTMTLDEIKNYEITPQMAEEMAAAAKAARESTEAQDEDCPYMSQEELKEFKPWYEFHSEQIRSA